MVMYFTYSKEIRSGLRLSLSSHQLDGRPRVVGKFVAHDSRPQFGSLKHAPGVAINPKGSSWQIPVR
jgi:hypothetical protein